MSNLFKLAGYQTDNEETLATNEKIEKIAEAMDYLYAHNIDPIGGLVVISNTDADGNILDEKVASVAEKDLTPEQAAELIKVAEYLGGVDENDIRTAVELQKEAAEMVEKLAEAKEAVESVYGVPFEDVMYVASLIDNADNVDEKTASEVVNAGYGENELALVEKIASEVAEYTGLTPEEALESSIVLAETPEEQEKIAGLVSKIKEIIKKVFNRGSGTAESPKISKIKEKIENVTESASGLGKSFKDKVKKLYEEHPTAVKAGLGAAAAAGAAGAGYAGYKGYKSLKKKSK